jgi:lipopolysaccharide export system protein LptA
MFQAKHSSYIHLVSFLLSAAFYCLSLQAIALPSDKFAIVNIKADSGIYNFKTGVDIYEGHVKIDQGSTHILADKLITKKNAQHKIQEAIAYGYTDLAHFWTFPKENDEELHAFAKIIRFYPLEANTTLEQSVVVTQGKNRFQGELIHYNSADQIINLPASANGRAQLVYNPNK